MKLCALVVASILCASGVLAQQQDHFVLYSFPSDGFTAAFPSKPLEFRTPGRDGSYSTSYQALVPNPPSQYSIFVSHSPKRVFEPESIAAYLNGLVRGLVAASQGGKARLARNTVFHGFPSIEYEYDDVVGGLPVVSHGIALVIDGEHVRLSQIYSRSDSTAQSNFRRFTDSFQLTAIDAPLSATPFADIQHGVSFNPPDGWTLGTARSEQIVAVHLSPAGHSVTILDSAKATYRCDSYQAELESLGETVTMGTLSTGPRQVRWFKATAFNPSAKIRMTHIDYCIESSKGAVVMLGAAPETTFFRSQIIFEKVARSMAMRGR
jgi:hypothetical protein